MAVGGGGLGGEAGWGEAEAAERRTRRVKIGMCSTGFKRGERLRGGSGLVHFERGFATSRRQFGDGAGPRVRLVPHAVEM